MIDKIHIIVALFAALAITILSLFQDITFYSLSIRLVIIIPIFFILGLIFRFYIKKIFVPPETADNAGEQGDESKTDADGEGGADADAQDALDDEDDYGIDPSYNPYDVDDGYGG